MKKFTKHTVTFFEQYWQFCLAAIAALVSLGFLLWGSATVTHWILGSTALLLAMPIIWGMWESIRNGSYGLDILALTAIITSVILHEYWAAIVIVIMLTGGQALEDFAKHRAHSELKGLLERAPQQAHVLHGRKTVDVAATAVHPGDKIFIKVGEVVPVDAIIIEGTAGFDESSLTGESRPVSKTVDQQILSGSINLDGPVTARALHTSADSQYQQIVRLVKNAGAAQTPFVRLADRYSLPFTAAAYAIAIAAWVIGHEAIRFLEVIVVATPCPLLLAAPIALVSGMSRASKYGIIVRTGTSLEKLAEAQTFAFDKTGTLTGGQLEVHEITALAPYTKTEVLGLAASLEQASVHVLAQAITREADARHYNYAKAKHVQEFSGRGLKAMFNRKEVLVGQLAFLHDMGIDVKDRQLSHQTATYVAVNGKLAGIISFRDEIRPESKGVIEQLKKAGVKQLMMITGDNRSAAEAVAQQLGIQKVIAGASPADKLHAIERAKYRPAAFVGDGVNDAPVLTAADIGIALGARGSTAASESADVIIMPDDISFVSKAVVIAKRTFSIARQSIVIGIALSLVLMLIFATGHFPPLLGAVLQEVVDVFVIFNALRAHLNPKNS